MCFFTRVIACKSRPIGNTRWMSSSTEHDSTTVEWSTPIFPKLSPSPGHWSWWSGRGERRVLKIVGKNLNHYKELKHLQQTDHICQKGVLWFQGASIVESLYRKAEKSQTYDRVQAATQSPHPTSALVGLNGSPAFTYALSIIFICLIESSASIHAPELLRPRTLLTNSSSCQRYVVHDGCSLYSLTKDVLVHCFVTFLSVLFLTTCCSLISMRCQNVGRM